MEIKELYNAYLHSPSINRMMGTHHFNVLDALQGSVVENSHSKILMQLLRFCEQGHYVFLESLLHNRFGFELALTDTVHFECEKAYVSDRLDGLIYSVNQFAIIIENKVNGAKLGTNQLGKYIDAVSSDKDIFADGTDSPDKVWVVYLTRDGNDPEDQPSIQAMAAAGIIDAPVTGEFIAGPRYVSASYREHILPWLEQDVYPMIRNNCQEMSAGVMQYICYLKGANFFDMNDTPLNDEVTWLKNQVTLPDDPVKSNKMLHQFYVDCARECPNDPAKNRLLNVISAVAQEPMQLAMQVTRSHFAMCQIWQHFTYNYINMRPTEQNDAQGRIYFSWYPLGMNRLTSADPIQYTFAINVLGSDQERCVFAKSHGLMLHLMGYTQETKNNKLVYRYQVPMRKGLLLLPLDEQQQLLQDTYNRIMPCTVMKRLVSSLAGDCTQQYLNINDTEKVGMYQQALADIYAAGREEFGLRLAPGHDGLLLDTATGEVLMTPATENVGRMVIELSGLTDEQCQKLTEQSLAQEWFIDLPDYRTNTRIRTTVFGIEVPLNIRTTLQQTLNSTVERGIGAIKSLLGKG